MSDIPPTAVAMMNLSSEPPSLMMSLPEEILMCCIARVPRSYYPILALVSKQFRSIVTSSELYRIRSRLGFDEDCLYVAISKTENSKVHWYTLGRKPNNNHWLVPITSLPCMPLDASCVVIGSSIYTMGGIHEWGLTSQIVSRIDCVSHTVQPFTLMPKAVSGSVSQLIDGRIYVIGGSDTQSPELKSSSQLIMVFNTEANTWEIRSSMSPDWKVDQKWLSSVENAGKIYMRGYGNSYVYQPKKGKCTTDQILNSEEWLKPCIVDNIMYYYDIRQNCLRAYDLKNKAWRIVLGVEFGRFEDGSKSWTESYGGNLAVFLQKEEDLITKTTEIWCAKIAVEKREDGEIWGNIKWYDLVLSGKYYMMDCLSVKV